LPLRRPRVRLAGVDLGETMLHGSRGHRGHACLSGVVAALLALGALGFAPVATAAPRIVFHSQSSPAGLWAMQADGGGPHSFLAGADGADFSADGTKLTYQVGGSVACQVDNAGQVKVANADGSGVVAIGSGGCDPRISPDGTQVAYIGPFSNGIPAPVLVASVSDPAHPHQILPFANCINLVNTTFGTYPNRQSVCNNDQTLDWVDNSNLVVSGYQNGLWVLPAAGGDPHPILTGVERSSDWYDGLSVSPDGATIAGYPLSQSAAAFVLATVPAAGAGALGVLYTQQGNSGDAYEYPEWSPDGKTLALQHIATSGALSTDRVAVMPATGGAATDLNPSDANIRFPTFAPPAGNHILKGVVTDGSGAPSAGVTFSITGATTTTATTDAQGHFSIDLPDGSYSVAPQTAGTVFPVPGFDCAIFGDACRVTLDRDRAVAFSGCVVPDPGGGKLPPSAPDPIPGAVVLPPLEAIGCWKPQNGGGSDPTSYTTTQPARLDGIDVVPAPGTTLTLNAQALTVSSDGFAQMLVGGFPITPEIPLRLTYHPGAAAAPVSVDDLGAQTTPFAPKLFGIPLFVSGGPVGFLPVQETTGQTVFNAGFQFPLDTRARWSIVGGKFIDEALEDVPSAGVSGTITATNRSGVQGQLCLSVNDWKPFKGDFGEILGAQLCFNPTQRLWTGQGQFELPSGLARLAGEINIQFTSQNVPSARTAELQGYQLQSFQVQFDHLNTQTFTLPGFDPQIRSSGLPIGGGFFLQSLGGGFSNDLATGTVTSVNGTAGITFGPEFQLNHLPLTLVRLDGELVLAPPKTTNDFWTYTLKGAATIGRLTPFELQFANLAVTYIAKPGFGEGDVRGHAGADLPVVGGLSIDLAGHQDAKNGLLLDGSQRVRIFGGSGTNEVLLDNTILADCVTAGSYTSGFDFDFATGRANVGCNLGTLHRPSAMASAAHASAAGGLSLRLPRGLTGTMLAIRGRGAPPKVELSGGRQHITAVPRRHPVAGARQIIYADPKTDATYVSLLRPAAGTWTVHSLPGSARLRDVREADPLPRPAIVGRMKPAGCSDVLSYTVRGAGEHILLYAQEGERRTMLGSAKPHGGRVTVALPNTSGRGQIVAVFLRAGHPVGERRIATFPLRPSGHRACAQPHG